MRSKINAIILLIVITAVIAGSVMLYGKLTLSTSPEQPTEASVSDISVVYAPSSSPSPAASSDIPEAASRTTDDFTVLDLDGNEVRLSDLRGKPVILNFWASWCPSCKSEMPDFQKAFDAFGGEVSFMMINSVSPRETVEKGTAYIEQEGFTFPVYFDTSKEGATVYAVSALPTTVFIDAQGQVLDTVIGAIKKEDLFAAVSRLFGLDTVKSAQYRKLTPLQAKEMMDSGEAFTLLDVRSQQEHSKGYIKGSLLIPDSEVARRAAQELPDMSARIIVYCQSGVRSERVARQLLDLGYTEVYDMGGVNDWPYELVTD